jgi:hypothetical protein
MPNTPSPSKFFTAMTRMRALPEAGPVNHAAIRRDAGFVFEKATALIGYQAYLGGARSWKARARAVPIGFEREVQAQAAGALADTHALASAALRMTSQFKQSGQLDRMFTGCTATLAQSGPVAASDLVAGLQHDPSIRETLRNEGVTDEVWTSLLTTLTTLDANVSTQDGKLTADLKAAGENQRRTMVVAPSPTGMPRTLPDLLRRGTFERMAARFIRGGGNLQLLSGAPRDLEVPEVVMAASLFSMESMAAHKRGLQDAGLAKYAGNAPAVIFAVAALAALVIGYLLVDKYCKHDGSEESAACIAASILFILGLLASGLLLLGGLLLLFGVSGSSSGTGDACLDSGNVYHIDLLTGEVGCGPKST